MNTPRSYDPIPPRRVAFIGLGVMGHPMAGHLARADIVYACGGNDADLRAVTTGPDGAFAGMKPGAIFVDHTTASAEVARELHAQARKLG